MAELPAFTLFVGEVEYTAEHAVVKEFRLAREDHGIFTAFVTFEGNGWSQGLPLFHLKATRGMDYLIALVDALGTPWRGIGVNTPVIVLRKSRHGSIEGFAVVKGAEYGPLLMTRDFFETGS